MTINGVVFLIAGVAEIGIGMHAQGWGRFFLWVIGGMLYLFVGLVCIFNPIFASAALTLMLGAGLDRRRRRARLSRLSASRPIIRARMVFLAAAVTILLGLIIVIALAGQFGLGAGNSARRRSVVQWGGLGELRPWACARATLTRGDRAA